jgi:hypothetical protein
MCPGLRLHCSALFLLECLIGASGCRPSDKQPRGSIVHITTPRGSGTGFFTEGPSGPLVATAFHIIAFGDKPIVEREVTEADGTEYVEAFPQVTVAAFDASADLALLQIKNFPQERAAPLHLLSEVKRDSEITSWGFPASSVAQNLGLTMKRGQVSNLVKLPVIDGTYGRIVKEDAIDGVIVSTDLEPGFSGGPTVDAANNVVAVNVLKDKAHRGQNAGVQAKVLAELIESLKKPVGTPTQESITALLKNVEVDYLRLPTEQRPEAFPTEIVALSELPFVFELANYLRTYLRSGSTAAPISLLFAKSPGEFLSTYFDKTTTDRVTECEKSSTERLGGLAGTGRVEDCRALEVRPLVWDLTAITLQWAGEPRSYSVGKVEEVSPERQIFRAQLAVSGRANTFPIYLSSEANRLRLRVTDENGKLYGLFSNGGWKTEDYAGRWVARESRTTTGSGVTTVLSETLDIGPTPTGRVSASHLFSSVAHAPDGKTFTCNNREDVRDTITQAFEGDLVNGVVDAAPTRDLERPDTRDCPFRCGIQCSFYTQDTSVVFKRMGPELVMYRTTGHAIVETQRFVKEASKD